MLLGSKLHESKLELPEEGGPPTNASLFKDEKGLFGHDLSAFYCLVCRGWDQLEVYSCLGGQFTRRVCYPGLAAGVPLLCPHLGKAVKATNPAVNVTEIQLVLLGPEKKPYLIAILSDLTLECYQVPF